MSKVFHSPFAEELRAFLQFKRSLGYGYMRAEFSLWEFDRFLIEYAARNHPWQFDQAALAWLASKSGRKPVSVSGDAAVLRQFYRYLRRSSKPETIVEPIWPHLPTESSFVPYFLSGEDIKNLLKLCVDLKRQGLIPRLLESGGHRRSCLPSSKVCDDLSGVRTHFISIQPWPVLPPTHSLWITPDSR